MPDSYSTPDPQLDRDGRHQAGNVNRPLRATLICLLYGLAGIAALLNMILIMGNAADTAVTGLSPTIQIARNLLTAGFTLGLGIVVAVFTYMRRLEARSILHEWLKCRVRAGTRTTPDPPRLDISKQVPRVTARAFRLASR